MLGKTTLATGQHKNPEEAKQIGKCILEALADASLQIVPVSK